MKKGKIKWYSETKAYGFITGEDAQDYFFHKTGVATDFTPFEGANVTFEENEGRKGLKAVNVQRAA